MIAKRSMVAAALLLAVLPLPARAQRAVYLVRHADKANNDPDTPLSTKGIERAEALAALLEHAGVKAVYTSQFRRSKETAAPLATKLGLDAQVVSEFPAKSAGNSCPAPACRASTLHR